jgi:hypothetical protein
MNLQSPLFLLSSVIWLIGSHNFHRGSTFSHNALIQPPNVRLVIQNSINAAAVPAAMSLTEQRPSTCSNIESVGSPILMVNQVQSIINGIMSQANTATFVQFIYHDKVESTLKFSTIHTMIFKLVNYGSAWFVGIRLDNHSSGIASAKFLKFILNTNLEVVSKVLGLAPNTKFDPGFRCGDLKMIYSSFGNDGGRVANHPGTNRNRMPLGLYELLKQLKPTPQAAIVRQCDSFRFIKSPEFYFSPLTNTETRPTFPLPENTPNKFEIFRCSPEGTTIIEAIEFDCQSSTASLFNARLVSVKLTYKIPFQSTTETTQAFGKATPSGVGNYSYKDRISLDNIGLITGYYLPNGAAAFRFFSKTRTQLLVSTFNCGNTLGFTSGQPSDSVQAEDLLGFWGRVGGTDSRLTILGFLKYSSLY